MMSMSLIEMSRDKTIDNEDFRECVLRHICVNGFGEEIYNDHIVRTSLCDFIKEIDMKMATSAVKRDLNVKVSLMFGSFIAIIFHSLFVHISPRMHIILEMLYYVITSGASYLTKVFMA